MTFKEWVEMYKKPFKVKKTKDGKIWKRLGLTGEETIVYSVLLGVDWEKEVLEKLNFMDNGERISYTIEKWKHLEDGNLGLIDTKDIEWKWPE